MKNQNTENFASLWRGNPIHDHLPEDTYLDQNPEYKYLDNNATEHAFNDPTKQQLSQIPDSVIHHAYADLDSKFQQKLGPFQCRLVLDRTQFLAGDKISGHLELQCNSSKRCRLGKIEAAVYGIEECTAGKKQNDRRLFLYTAVPLQGPLLAPSDAVIPGPADVDGFWQARKGDTRFSFLLKLPTTANINGNKSCISNKDDPYAHQLPSSFYINKVGGARYFVKVSVSAKYGTKKLYNLASVHEINVIAAHHQHLKFVNTFNTSLYAMYFDTAVHAQNTKLVKSRWLKKAHSVSIQLYVHCARNLEEESSAWVAGTTNYATVEIENGSTKPIKTLWLSLNQKIKFNCISANGSVVSSQPAVVKTIARKALHADASREHCSTFKSSKSFASARDWNAWSFKELAKRQNSVKGQWCGTDPQKRSSTVLDFVVPASLQTITSTRLVQLSYELSAECPEIGLKTTVPVQLIHSLSVMATVPPVEIERLPDAKIELAATTSSANLSLLIPAPEHAIAAAAEPATFDLSSGTSNYLDQSIDASRVSTPSIEGMSDAVASNKSTPIAGVWNKHAVQSQDSSEGILAPMGHTKYFSQSSFLSRTSLSSCASPTASVPQYQRYNSSPLQRGMSVTSMSSASATPYIIPHAPLVAHSSSISSNSTVRQNNGSMAKRIPLMSDKVCTIRRKRSLAIDQLIESLRNEDISKSVLPPNVIPGENKLTALQATFDSQTTMIHDLCDL